MFTEGNLNSFKELMNEIFYDWGFTTNPQIKFHSENGWWINKTYITKASDNHFYLHYKTEVFSISEKALDDFKFFYENLFLTDLEFQEILNSIEQEWNESSPIVSEKEIVWGDLSIKLIDFKYQMNHHGIQKEINKRVFQKIQSFIKLTT